jgi:methylated-DNA-protein-cysteine methyltransferase related protein
LSTLARLRWVIASVPRGKVITYGQVASAGGFPGAARLTVRALYSGEGLPWHRVVGAGGRIALPGEDGREQRLRLEMEGVKFRGGRVLMELHNWVPRVPARRRGRPQAGKRVRARRSATRRVRGLRPQPSRGTRLGSELIPPLS